VRNGCGYTVGELLSPIRFHRCFICSDSLVSEAEVFSNLAPSAITLLPGLVLHVRNAMWPLKISSF
jgi:hypothetical protein